MLRWICEYQYLGLYGTLQYITFIVRYLRDSNGHRMTFLIEPGLEEALRTAAQREHRSIANMVAVLILDYCERNGIAIPRQQALFKDNENNRKREMSKHAGNGQGI